MKSTDIILFLIFALLTVQNFFLALYLREIITLLTAILEALP